MAAAARGGTRAKEQSSPQKEQSDNMHPVVASSNLGFVDDTKAPVSKIIFFRELFQIFLLTNK